MQSVLILSFWNPTKEDPAKGRFIHEQANAILSLRSDIIFMTVDIFPSWKNIYTKSLNEKEIDTNKIISLTINSVFAKLMYLCPVLIAFIIYKLLKKHYPSYKPSIIHSNIIFPCGIVGYILSKKFNSRHIISEHWSKVQKHLKHPFFGQKSLLVYRKSFAIICVSNFLAAALKQETGHDNINIVPNIINTNTFKFKPKDQKKNQISFTCVAFWKLPKRLDLIIQSVVKWTNQTQMQVELNIVGEGIQVSQFYPHNIPNNLTIIKHGHISKPEIAKVLNQTDFFLHASEIETFSIVTAEALCTGTPVLASKVGALPELINPTNGRLVKNTLEDWVIGLNEITSTSFDSTTIASQNVERYTAKSVAETIINLYNQ